MRPRALAAVALAVTIAALAARPARAFNGDRCRSTARDCNEYEVCVADNDSADTGTCRHMKVLP